MITRRLSLSSINKTAPYQVWTENGYTFLFRTGDGVTYEIGFVEDCMISDDGDVSQLIISVVNGDASHRDSKIQDTVTAILEEYFKTDYSTLVYICDTNDGRQSFRQRLFSIWFHSYSEKDRFFHEYKELIIDGIGYYMAILSRKDNPLLPDRLAAFESVFKQISAK